MGSLEIQLEQIISAVAGEVGWMIIIAIAALTFKNTIQRVVEGMMFFFGGDYKIDDIVYISGTNCHYRWVVIERVNPWKGNNEAWIKAFFPEFAELDVGKDISPTYARNLWQIFESFTLFMIDNIKEGDDGKDAPVNAMFVPELEEGPSGMPEKKQREIREKGYPARIAFEKKLGPLYKRFVDLAAEYNVEPFDIVDRNVGTRADDSFVILDLSVFEEGASF